MSEPLIDLRPDHLQIVRGILKKIVPELDVWAFGSRAKWLAKPYSDLDLAIISDTPLSLALQAALTDDFAESDLPFRVDIVDWATTKENFRQIIEQDKVVLQKANPVGRVSPQGDTRSLAETNADVGLRCANPTYAAEWRRYTVDDLVFEGILAPPLDGNHGATHPKASDFVASGIPFIMASDMKAGHVDTTNCAFITYQQASNLRKGFAKTGDVLLSHKATIGRTALVRESGFEYLVLTPQVTYYRALMPNRLNNRYLKFYFDSEPFQQILAAWAGAGSTRAYLGITAQRKLPIVLPPIEIQNVIAETMGTLDDRIALLRETNATLEAIAQALFKSWFVDFDPVHAKQQGRAPEGMDEATAALFPDSFEESELGLVPRGWSHSTVGKSFILTMGQSPPGDTYNNLGDGLAFYQGRTDFGFRFPTKRVFCTAPKRLAEIGDTLVSVRAPVGDVNMALEQCCLGRGVAAVRHPLGYRSFPFYTIRGLRTKFDMYDSEGTVFGSINKKDFESLPVIQPSKDILSIFDEIASPIDRRVVDNEEQMRTLATLRDTLLPRLISGQLRLPEDTVV